MDNILIEVEKYATNLIRTKLPHMYLYHNMTHTQRVVKSTKELINGEKIEGEDAEDLGITSWLHDIGYIEGIENHEEKSVALASKYLAEQGMESTRIEKISELILATKMEYEPKNLLEKIIRDADCSHFKSKNFIEISELLRNEWELTCDKTFNDIDWIKENITFLTKKHKYYTSYAIDNWQKGKEKNIASLFKILKKLQKEEKKNTLKVEQLALKKKKARLPERGIETMFRVTLRNHIALSDIADTKANILLSVNAIIVSLVLANLLPKLDNPTNKYLILPTVIFISFTIIAMILSVLATRPNVTGGKFTKKDVEDKKVNLLFFGNFHKMKLKDFEWAMNELMNDRGYLYSSMTKDLYFLGVVLNRKYKILRLTYTIFIIGILVSVTAFAIAFKYGGVRP